MLGENDKSDAYQTLILPPGEYKLIYTMQANAQLLLMHVSTEDGFFTVNEQPDFFFNFTGLENFNMNPRELSRPRL